ncbi:MAG: acyl carrier protein [Nitrospinota bacterium]
MTAELKTLFAQVMGVDPASVCSESTMDKIASWDSLRHLELATAIEKHYSLTLSMQEIIAITSYSKLCEILAARGIAPS